MGNQQEGQSLVEFVASCGVLVILLTAIPMVGKLGTLQLKANSAADYAAWRLERGAFYRNDSNLNREVGQRFFAKTGADVLSDQNAECDDIEDKDGMGNSMVSWRNVSVKTSRQSESSSAVNTTAKLLNIKDNQLNNQHRMTIEVPVSNSFIEGVPATLTIRKTAMTLTSDMRSSGVKDTLKTVQDSLPLTQYEIVKDAGLLDLANVALSVFNERTIKKDKDIYQMEVVPNDRLSTYR